MPNVAEFEPTTWQFSNHMSGGNSTQPGLFSLFYSLPSSYWTAALKQDKSPVFIDMLLRAHYSMKIIWSMPFASPAFDKTVFKKVNPIDLVENQGRTVGDADRATTQQAIRFLTERKEDTPFFLYLFYDSVHAYCTEQSFPTVFQPARKRCVRLVMTNEIDPLPYYNRYLNAVRFVDGEVGKVLATIKEQGYLDNSIIIFTADHGQEFNDNHQNYWEHAGNFTPVQVQIPFLIHWPGDSPKKISYLTSSYDMVPTVMQRLFSCKNPPEDYSIGQNLLNENDRHPFVLMGSYVNMGVYEPNRITTLEASGRIVVTDTKAKPLPNAQLLDENVNQALRLMRKYFINSKE
jgi:membrane-anchored protein YejM (alkaline phosphatase superfamily)